MLSERIANLRKEKKISQEQLAEVLNTTRQAVSKWERGEAYPDIDRIKELAIYFNVSIDYLLEYDLASSSVNTFIDRIKKCYEEQSFNVSEEDMRLMISKNSNNFNLYFHTVNYLIKLWSHNPSDHIASLIVEYSKKALLIYRTDDNNDVSVYDIQRAIVCGYTMMNRHDLAKEYIKDNKLNDMAIELAECEYELGNYKEALYILSETFLKSIAQIVSVNITQARLLIKTNRISEAYELVNWSISFINSVGKKESLLLEVVYILNCFKAICEKHLGLDWTKSLAFLKNNKHNFYNRHDDNSDDVKFYYNEKVTFAYIFKDIETIFKEELASYKNQDVYNDALFIYNKLFGE